MQCKSNVVVSRLNDVLWRHNSPDNINDSVGKCLRQLRNMSYPEWMLRMGLNKVIKQFNGGIYMKQIRKLSQNHFILKIPLVVSPYQRTQIFFRGVETCTVGFPPTTIVLWV